MNTVSYLAEKCMSSHLCLIKAPTDAYPCSEETRIFTPRHYAIAYRTQEEKCDVNVMGENFEINRTVMSNYPCARIFAILIVLGIVFGG